MGEFGSSLLASIVVSSAFLHGVESGGGLLVWLNAVVVIFGVSLWALHGAVATSDSHEKIVTFGLVSSWGNFFTVTLSVGSLASSLSIFEVESTALDLLLKSGWEIIILSEKSLNIIRGSDSFTLDSENASQAREFTVWHSGSATDNNEEYKNIKFHCLSF
jgi:hypothetical protein